MTVATNGRARTMTGLAGRQGSLADPRLRWRRDAQHAQSGRNVLVDEVILWREPRWSDADGLRGSTSALLQTDTQREAVLEFPPPKRLLKGLQRGRLQHNDAIVSHGIRAALAAGREPTSRGKPMVFMVDADRN